MRRVLVLFLALLPCKAQDFRGSLAGVVADSSGGRVQSADVFLHASESSLERQTKADSRGEFRFDDLSPGSYRLVVRAPGFAEASSNVAVMVSTVREVSVTLNLRAERQALNVQAQASSIVTQPVDTISAVHGGAVTAQDLETIPLAHRSFANIAYLVPGTEPVEPSDPTKARITAVSFGGSSGLNDVSFPWMAPTIPTITSAGFCRISRPTRIQEFAVQTSQENADTGRTVGGSVVITTKRGTNQWHGEAAFYERAAALNARYPDRESRAPAQAAVLPAELHWHARRTHRRKTSLVLLRFPRSRPRRRQHRLQPGQPDAIQRAGFAGAQG